MCAWVAAIVQAVGSDVSAAGNVYNLHQQAKTADTNAVRAQSAAADAIAQGEWQAANQRLQSGRLMAKQKTSAAASGFDVNSESYSDVMAGSAQNAHLDVQQLLANAYRTQENYLNESADFRQAAKAYRRSALYSVVGGALMAGGSAAQAYSQANGWKKKESPTQPSLWGTAVSDVKNFNSSAYAKNAARNEFVSRYGSRPIFEG